MGPCTQGGLYLVVRVECGTSKLDMGGWGGGRQRATKAKCALQLFRILVSERSVAGSGFKCAWPLPAQRFSVRTEALHAA